MKAGERICPTLLVAGFKGMLFVTGVLEAGITPLRIISYPQWGDKSDSFSQVVELGRRYGIRVEESRHPNIAEDSLVFLVGWQFLLREGLDRCVAFHDSLLPELRGFSPTVTALLLGLDVIGVTAIRPDHSFDSGPICGSRRINISQGLSIRAALELQSRAMVDLAIEILQRASNDTMVEQIQDQDAGTFSLWRDEYDYFIDWRSSASEILRLVQALGFPYEGAKGIIDNELVTVQQARLGPDPSFAIRSAGKLWQTDGRKALVVCGSGTLWIDEAFDGQGQPFHFQHLRARFLTPDTAWIATFLRSRVSP
jgi:methionyl-tRNA formyltransferase